MKNSFSISRLSVYIGSLLIVAMMLLTVSDVVMRYFFTRPLRGVVEYSEMMMVGMTFGMVWAALQGRHIKVDFVYNYLSKKSQAFADVITLVLSLVMCALIAWTAYTGSVFSRAFNMQYGFIKVPLYPLMWIFAIAFIVLCVGIAALVIKRLNEVIKK